MKLYGKIIGTGKPFVILHGFLGMGDNWKTMAGQFAEEGYAVHLVDQRNHGRSPHSDDFSYVLLARDLKEYCDANGLGSILLLGHSMGGKTAMNFAVEHPDRVEKLLVADIAPKYYAPHHQEILDGLGALAADTEALSSRGAADDFLKAYIQDWGTRQFLLKNLYWQKDKTLALRVNLPVLTEKVEAIGEALTAGGEYPGKTLFLRGEKSNYIQDEDFSLIKKHFPNSDIVSVPKAGHWLHAENPKDFYQDVLKFL